MCNDLENPVSIDVYRPRRISFVSTNKPINITAVDIDGLKDQLEMAYIRLGGKDEWRKGPAFSLYIEPVSPLSHSE